MIRSDDHFEDMRQRERDGRHFREAGKRMRAADGLQQQMAENRRSIMADMSAYIIGLAALLYLAAALSGYIWAATGFALVCLLICFIWRVCRIASTSAERSETASDLRNPRLGINTKWGRFGAKRKNKNA